MRFSTTSRIDSSGTFPPAPLTLSDTNLVNFCVAERGFAAETSDLTPAADLLAQFGELPGLSKLLERLGVKEESPGVAASAVEFALEGLHLSRRLNKDEAGRAGAFRYRGTDSA